MRRRLAGLRMLVTGASSGIGRSLAQAAAALGMRLMLTARRQGRLESLASEISRQGGEAHFVAGDICDATVRERLILGCRERLGGLDVLVNNAGVGAYGPFETASTERLRRVMEVNFFAPVELIRDCLPLLRDGKTPVICNISSVLAHRAVPDKSEYCASKFALHGFSDALRAELAGQVDVVLVSPSTTESEFSESVIERKSENQAIQSLAQSPQSVARTALRAIRLGQHEAFPSRSGHLLVLLDRFFPLLANWAVQRRS